MVAGRNVSATMGGFTPLFDRVIQDVGIIGASVFGRMWRYCQGDRGVCQASTATIAGELNSSTRTVIRWQQELKKLGYLEDTTPDLRNKPHTYRVTNKVTIQVSIGVVTESHSSVTESHSQYDRESLEETHEETHEETKTTGAQGAVSPEQEAKTDITDFFDGDVPELTPPIKPTIERKDAVADIVHQAGRRAEDSLWWLRPGTACGDHDYLEPYQVFCGVIGRDPSTVGEHKTAQWLKRLGEIAVVSQGGNGSEPVIIQPGVMAQAIQAIRDDWSFTNKKWRTPYNSGFADLVELTAAQIVTGNLPGESKGWSTSL
jgi:hypothetical protein